MNDEVKPERDEKAGEERVEELLDALDEYGDHGPRCAMHNVDITEPRVCDCGFDTARRRAPAQPARSTREDDVHTVLRQRYQAECEACSRCQEMGAKAAADAHAQRAVAFLESANLVAAVNFQAALPPAREKDGEARTKLVDLVEWVEEHGGYAMSGERRAEFEQLVLAYAAAPRSPSPLSASTTPDYECVTCSHKASEHNEAGCAVKGCACYRRRSMLTHPPVHWTAPSIAQQAASSEAGVPSDFVAAADALRASKCDDECEKLSSSVHHGDCPRFVAMLAYDKAKLASRGARGTEDVLRGTVSCLLRASEPKDIKARPLDLDGVPGFWVHKPYAEFLCARWQETHHDLAMSEPVSAERDAVIEECARVCEEISKAWLSAEGQFASGHHCASLACADTVRALKSPPAPSSASVHVSACKISDDDIAASFGVTPNNRGGAG